MVCIDQSVWSSCALTIERSRSLQQEQLDGEIEKVFYLLEFHGINSYLPLPTDQSKILS